MSTTPIAVPGQSVKIVSGPFPSSVLGTVAVVDRINFRYIGDRTGYGLTLAEASVFDNTEVFALSEEIEPLLRIGDRVKIKATDTLDPVWHGFVGAVVSTDSPMGKVAPYVVRGFTSDGRFDDVVVSVDEVTFLPTDETVRVMFVQHLKWMNLMDTLMQDIDKLEAHRAHMFTIFAEAASIKATESVA